MVATGLYYALLSFLLAGLLGRFVTPWAATPLVLFGLFCLWFFRDPERAIPRGTVAVSPADGKVVLVRHRPERTEVCIFMNVFDVHVNRAPISGRITKIAYKPGIFVNADLDKASEDNERNGLIIDTKIGRFGVVQIAGLIARRIVCFTREGEQIGVGDRFGLIRFGSRVDVYMPSSARVTVAVGSRAVAGETVLADMTANAPALTFKSA